MPTSILHSLTTFLSRRYNLNNSSTPSSNSRDRESLARDVAYSLKHIPTTTTTQSQQQQLIDGTITASVEDGNDDLETTLQELQQTLSTCDVSLKEFESKERFLYVRIERYRELIRERECLIRSNGNAAGMQVGEDRDGKMNGSSENDDDNVETSCKEEEDEEEIAAASSKAQDGNDLKNYKHKNLTQEQLTQLQQKHHQDQTNLQTVETIHAEIIVQIETIKRRIVELTEKQHDIVRKREECQEFLVEFAEREGHL